MGRSGTRSGFYRFMVLLLSLAAIVFIGTEVFQVEKCTVIGSHTLDKDVIINISGVSKSDNIFKIDKKLVKSRIEGSAPFPKVLGVTIKLPDEVIISIEERIPVALIPYLSSYLVIDGSGFILDITKEDSVPNLPIVEGVHVTSLTKGNLLEVSKSDNYRYKVLTVMLEAIIEWGSIEQIYSISLDNPDEISLLTRDEISIYVGQAVDLDRKLGWLNSEAYTKVLQNEQEGSLDVSVPGKAVFHPDPIEEKEEETGSEESTDN